MLLRQRNFTRLLRLCVGRESHDSVILNLYGHQLVAHVTDELAVQKGIYPRHFGLIFDQEADWQALLERSCQHQLQFYQQPKHRFPGLPLEPGRSFGKIRFIT